MNLAIMSAASLFSLPLIAPMLKAAYIYSARNKMPLTVAMASRCFQSDDKRISSVDTKATITMGSTGAQSATSSARR